MRHESQPPQADPEAIFATLLQLPLDEREEYLEQACPDEDTRARVEEMAAAHAGAAPAAYGEPEAALRTDPGDYRRDTPDPDAAAVAADAAPLPGRIGPYRVVKLLGQGGMGTVFLAQQTAPIERLVALKVIRRSNISAEMVHRFESERQVLARMSHPHIAQVYEAGDTPEGDPYFAMEYAPGEPITDYCDRHALTVEQRLGLFVAVCQAIHHAHQKGVLHRDIKPANLLVTEVEGRPFPKVIDFGIAKALDRQGSGAGLTVQGMVVGTPSYLSPEALQPGEGPDPDTRSDVYALGVLLYELLCGTRPFGRVGDSLLAVISKVLEEDVEPPSRRLKSLHESTRKRVATARDTAPAALRRKLAGDLDGITLMAMARRRDDRYDSAAALANDVERHLADLPVIASRPGGWEHAAKFVRRNRMAVAAAVLVTLSLVGGLTARTVEARRAEREAARANREAAAAQQVASFLEELFLVSDPGESRGSTITARELLDRGAARIQDELATQPLTRARLMLIMARVYRGLGLRQPILPLLRKSLALRQTHLAPGHPEVAEVLVEVGRHHYGGGRYEESERAWRRALEIRRASFGEDHPTTAEALLGLGDLYELQGRFSEAEPLLREALAVRETALGADHLETAESVDRLGVMLIGAGRAEEALPLFERVVAIRRPQLGDDHPGTAFALNGLAIAVSRIGDHQRARDLFAETAAIRERVLGPDHVDLAQSLNNLAVAELDLGRTAEAIALLHRAAEIYAGALGADNPRVSNAWFNLGSAYRDAGDPVQAERYLRRGAEVIEEALGREAFPLARILHELGELAAEAGREEEAAGYLARALALRERELAADHPDVVTSREALASVRR